jgi:hypothetical protein
MFELVSRLDRSTQILNFRVRFRIFKEPDRLSGLKFRRQKNRLQYCLAVSFATSPRVFHDARHISQIYGSSRGSSRTFLRFFQSVFNEHAHAGTENSVNAYYLNLWLTCSSVKGSTRARRPLQLNSFEITLRSSSISPSLRPASSLSIITRSNGSVPEYRTTNRPRPVNSFSTSDIFA